MATRRDVFLGAFAGAAGLLAPRLAAAADPPVLLRLERRTIEVNGRAASVFGIRQADGSFGLTTAVGRPFRVRVENRIDAASLIHWHGLTPPWQQDGVPGISGPPIAPGGAAEYDFPLTFGGTFWMHSHQGLQEQSLMSAPLIIRDPRDRADQQEIVLFLADFSFTPPEQIFEALKKAPAMAGMGGAAPAPGGAMAAMPGMGSTKPGVQKASMTAPAKPAKPAAPDLNDVKYDAFLANDRTLADPQVVQVEPGGRVLLRIINGSSMSSYHVGLGALSGELVAVDGMAVAPVAGRGFSLAPAQRLDIRLAIPRVPAAHPVLAVLEGERSQSGIVLRAGAGKVTKLGPLAPTPSAPLTLALESRLRAANPLPPRKADRTHTLNLTGEMQGYVWSINGVAWNPGVPPLPLSRGERVELAFVNQTPMPHPMHLHGHTFQVVEIDGTRFPGARRDTVLVPPGRRVVVAFDADNPGWWAVHCHLLYHLDAGMFTTLRYT